MTFFNGYVLKYKLIFKLVYVNTFNLIVVVSKVKILRIKTIANIIVTKGLIFMSYLLTLTKRGSI